MSTDVPLRRLALAALLMLANACSQPVQSSDAADDAVPRIDSLVSTEWLSERLDDPDLVVLDCTVVVERTDEGGLRNISGRAGYEAGHIPTAGFADLTGSLSDSDSPYPFAMPTPEDFAAAMGALGVGPDTRVVLYDSYNSVWAARVWWMLRWIGFDQVAILDGGITAWKAENRPLSTEPPNHPPRQLTPQVRPRLIAYQDEVLASTESGAANLIDALPAGHFRCEWTMYGRPGHIPGASNIPTGSLVTEAGKYRSEDELAGVLGGDRDARTIAYCGGGVAASSVAFSMTRLGFKDVAVYMGSLQEWTADPSNPLEVSSDLEGLVD